MSDDVQYVEGSSASSCSEAHTLEERVIRGYKDETLSHFQASELLGLSRFEFDGWLKERSIEDHAYGPEDLQADLETILRYAHPKDSLAE